EYRYFFADRKQGRTLPQNAYYWGVVVKILSGHTGISPDEMHELLKYKFLKTFVSDPETGEMIEVSKSTSRLSTKEFTDFIDSIKDWALNSLNCYIPESGEVPDELIIEYYANK